MTTMDVTQQDLLQAVDRLRPVLEHHRGQAESERRLADAVVSAMKEEGLFRALTPAEYGGSEVAWPSFLRAVEKLAGIDASAAWIMANVASGGVQAAFMPDAGAREVFGGGHLTAGSVIPAGRAVPVSGGYRVTGRWPLTSGCYHAAWLGGNCLVFEGQAPRMNAHGAPDFTVAFFPSSDVKIIDTWHSTGMRGTGSADIAVEDVFVPEHRTFPLFTAGSRFDRPLFRLGIDVSFFSSLTCVGLGIARAAVDSFVELAGKKTPTLSQTGLAARPTVHAEVARAEATLQSARSYLFDVADEMWATLSAGSRVPEELEARRRLSCVNAAEACERVVDAMYRLGGVTSIYSGHALDRCLRDVHTVNQHLAVSPVWWEKTGQYYFGLGLGMP